MLGSVPIHKVLLQHGKVSASTLALSSEGFVLEGGSQKISVSWASVSAVDWSHAPLKPTCQLVLEFRKKEKLGGEVGSHYMLLELGVPAISLIECVLQADERLKSMAEQGIPLFLLRPLVSKFYSFNVRQLVSAALMLLQVITVIGLYYELYQKLPALMTWPIRAIANVAHVSIDHLYSAVCRVPEFILGKGYLFMALSMVFLIVTFPIYATWLVAVAWGFFILQISTGIFFILILFDKVNWITRNVKKLLAIVASTRRLVKSAPRVGSPSPVHDKPKFE